MTRSRLIILFVAAFLLALPVFAPLSMVMQMAAPSGALSAKSVTGSVWRGRISGAVVGGLTLGDIKTRLQVLPLLTGGLKLETTARGGAFAGTAVLVRSGRTQGVEDVAGMVSLDQVGLGVLAQGGLKLQGVTALFDRDRCAKAGGKATTQVGGSGLIPQPVDLSGQAVCQDGQWFLPLSGDAQGLRIEANITVAANGGWRTELILIPTDPALAQGLAESGFTQDGERWRRVLEGHS